MTLSEGRARRVAHNTFFLYAAEASARFFAGIMFVYLTRRWATVSTYGQYALVVNWAAILGVFSELGLNVLVVREVAHRREEALFYLRNAISIRSAFSLIFWAFLIGISFVLGYEPVLKLGMAVMGMRILLDSLSGGYVYLFQSHEMMGYYSMVNVMTSAIRLLGIVAVVTSRFPMPQATNILIGCRRGVVSGRRIGAEGTSSGKKRPIIIIAVFMT